MYIHHLFSCVPDKCFYAYLCFLIHAHTRISLLYILYTFSCIYMLPYTFHTLLYVYMYNVCYTFVYNVFSYMFIVADDHCRLTTWVCMYHVSEACFVCAYTLFSIHYCMFVLLLHIVVSVHYCNRFMHLNAIEYTCVGMPIHCLHVYNMLSTFCLYISPNIFSSVF